MTSNPYVVAVSATQLHFGTVLYHTIDLEAYNPSDAVVQAIFELDAEFNYTAQGYQLRALSVAPNTTESLKRLSALLDRWKLTNMPSVGSVS